MRDLFVRALFDGNMQINEVTVKMLHTQCSLLKLNILPVNILSPALASEYSLSLWLAQGRWRPQHGKTDFQPIFIE